MNYIALKVKIDDQWEYLDLNSDLSFTKSNELYLFSEVEYSRSVSVKIPNTEKNLEILNNPHLPVLETNNIMTTKLDCLLTLENKDIFGTLIINKTSEHYLNGTFVFDSCYVLDYINNKQVADIGLPDSQYSIEWRAQNFTYANDSSLDTKKIAIIPYMNDAITGMYEPNTPNQTPNAELFYKTGCWYPSIKLSALIYDILLKAKQDTNSNTDISHLFDEVPSGLINNEWIITDKILSGDEQGITFAKNGLTTVLSGPGEYGSLVVSEKNLKLFDHMNFWHTLIYLDSTGFKVSQDIDLIFTNLPDDNVVIAKPYSSLGYINLKTRKLMKKFSDVATIHNGEVIHLHAGDEFSFFNYHDAVIDLDMGSCLYFLDGNNDYIAHEYNGSNFSFNATILLPPSNPEDNQLAPYGTWKLSYNPIEVSVMDLIKAFAYTTGTQFVFEPADNKDPDRGSLKFVKTAIHSTKELHDITKIESLEKKVGSYSGKEILTFSPAEYVEESQSSVPSLEYSINNTNIESTNERAIPFDCGALPTINYWRFYFPDLSGNYMFPQNQQIFYRKDAELEIEANDDGSISSVKINYDSPGLTLAATSSTFNGSDYKRRIMRRLDQRFADPFPIDRFYEDIFDNSVKYNVQFPCELQEYMDLTGYTDFWIQGVRYAWFKLQWQKGIVKGEFQKYTKYLTSYYNINVLADPEMAGACSGGGSYQDGDNIIVSVIPQFGAILDYWEDEEGNIISHDLSFSWTVHEDKTFTAHFILPKYYVDLLSAPDGSYGSLSGEGYYDALSVCTCVAHPNPGYYFVGWYQNNQLLSTNTSYSFVVVSDTSLVGQFEQYPNYHITLGVEGVASGIEVGLSGQGYYQGGTTATVSVDINEIQRDSSYTFLGWYENDVQVSLSNPYSFTVERDRHLVAKFQHKVKITISSKNPYGVEGTWTGDGYYTQGDTAILQAFPNSGLQFLDWLDLDNNTVYSTSNPLIIPNIQTDLNLYIEWDSVETDIYVNILPRTGGTTTGQGTYAIGSTVRIEATPSTGYTFVKWVDELGTEIINNPYTFTAAVNKTFTPVYNQTTYTVSANVNPSNAGYVEGNGDTFHYNDLCVLCAIPYTRGYTFVNWTDENDNVVSTQTPYYFNVLGNTTLTANFTNSSTYYNVRCQVNPRGAGSVSGYGSYESGSSCTLIATANAGYDFLGYYNTSDVLVSSNATYTFTVNSDVNLVAKFTKSAPTQYTITLVNHYDEPGNTVQFGDPGTQYTITLVNHLDSEGNTVQFGIPGQQYTIELENEDDEAGTLGFVDNN